MINDLNFISSLIKSGTFSAFFKKDLKDFGVMHDLIYLFVLFYCRITATLF